MRRTACVALPEIRVEIARAEALHEVGANGGESASRGANRRAANLRSGPLAVVVAQPGGSLRTARDVLGNTRLDFVSREARALGVRSGMTVAAARAKSTDLHVRVVAENAVRDALVCIAEAALIFGPATAFDMGRDVVWVDVGGCAHLHGGENELAKAIEAEVRALGHVCRVAVADGPRIAAAVARFGPSSRKTHAEPVVVPEGRGAEAMRGLPIAALGLDEEVSAWLDELGLRACGDLQKLPRRSLGTRLGARAYDVMQLLDGEDHMPLDVWRPPTIPEERVELEWGVHSTEALWFVLKRLSDRLAVRLQGRALAAARLELVLTLDRGLCKPGQGSSSTLEMALPAPMAHPADLLAVVRARLERCSLSAPVVAATLRATELSLAPMRTLDLLEPEPTAERALPRLVAELAVEFGETSIGTLVLVDTWVPDERTFLLPFGAAAPVSSGRVLTSSSLEPSRLIRPSGIEGCIEKETDGNGRQHLTRIEAVEWWRRGNLRRDFFALWLHSPDVIPNAAPERGRASHGSWTPNATHATHAKKAAEAAEQGALGWVELCAVGTNKRAPVLRGWID